MSNGYGLYKDHASINMKVTFKATQHSFVTLNSHNTFILTVSVSIKYKLRTADYGLRTTDCGLGIKRGLENTDWV